MANIVVSWANPERTIIRVHAIDKWTWDDFYTAQQEITQLMQDIDHPVDMIIESLLASLPPNALSHFRRHGATSNRHMRRIVLVANHAFLRAMYQMYSTVVRKDNRRFIMVSTLDEAMRALQKVEV